MKVGSLTVFLISISIFYGNISPAESQALFHQTNEFALWKKNASLEEARQTCQDNDSNLITYTEWEETTDFLNDVKNDASIVRFGVRIDGTVQFNSNELKINEQLVHVFTKEDCSKSPNCCISIKPKVSSWGVFLDDGGNDLGCYESRFFLCSKNDICDSVPCKNNGTCTSNNGSYHCGCTNEYSGINCDEEFSSLDTAKKIEHVHNILSVQEEKQISQMKKATQGRESGEDSYLVKTSYKQIKTGGLPPQTLSRSIIEAVEISGVPDSGLVAVAIEQIDLSHEMKEVLSSDEHRDSGLDESLQMVLTSPILTISAYDDISNTLVSASPTFVIQDVRVLDNLNAMHAAGHTKKIVKSTSVECGFYDPITRTLSTLGCISIKKNETAGNLTCRCNHTTAFSALLRVEYIDIPEWIRILSAVAESLSVGILIITITVLLLLKKKLKSDRTFIQINLCFSLIFLHTLMLLTDLMEKDNLGCASFAVLSHYFILSTGSWMFCEGLALFFKVTKFALDFAKERPTKLKLIFAFIGWGIPLLIVGFSATIGFLTESYMDIKDISKYDEGDTLKYKLPCRVSSAKRMIYSTLIGPLAMCLVLNTFVVIIVSQIVYQLSKERGALDPSRSDSAITEELKHVKSTMKAVSLLIPTLGIPWIFGFLTNVPSVEASQVFMALHAVINGLQGLSVFCLYIILSSNVRSILQRELKSGTSTWFLTTSSSYGRSPRKMSSVPLRKMSSIVRKSSRASQYSDS